MDRLTVIIPVLSLIVAAVAVFIGPLVSLRIARRQVQYSLEVANKQVVAPMRQAWINSLRDLLAELSSSALHYYVAGYEDRSDEDYKQLTLLEHKVQLMLNVEEEDHRKLEQLIKTATSALSRGRKGDQDFEVAYTEIIKLSREVLKREWDQVKQPISTS